MVQINPPIFLETAILLTTEITLKLQSGLKVRKNPKS